MSWLTQKFISLTIPTTFAGDIGGKNPPSNSGSVTILNPLGKDATIQTLISNVVDFLVLIAIPILSLMVLYSAFQIMTARGDEKKFDMGKKTLLYAVIGFAILLVGEGLVKLLEVVITGGSLN